MDKEQVSRQLASMKGLAGSGNILSYFVEKIEGLVATMEPGDFVRSDTGNVSAAPVAADVWYLYYNENLLQGYFSTGPDFLHFDYSDYLAENLAFLELLPGLKPLKVLTDLDSLDIEEGFGSIIPSQYENNGMYWVNTLAFELWNTGIGMRYASAGPKNFVPNDYVGYIAFPVGQLGIMEVISILQETALSGYKFTAVDSNPAYQKKEPPDLTDDQKPSLQDTPEMFPDMKDSNGNAIAGQNYCFGRHIVESAYILKDRCENVADKLKDYEAVEPKMWMRYWIHKDDTLPVPGEFIGILTRPVSCPPHVWWFQESAPFLYAGNWVELNQLTSGVITAITDEGDRTDGGTGSQYTVKVQGCSILIDATDFFEYHVGDRVAIIKLDREKATESFAWHNQTRLKETDEGVKKTNFIIAPFTFYKAI